MYYKGESSSLRINWRKNWGMAGTGIVFSILNIIAQYGWGYLLMTGLNDPDIPVPIGGKIVIYFLLGTCLVGMINSLVGLVVDLADVQIYLKLKTYLLCSTIIFASFILIVLALAIYYSQKNDNGMTTLIGFIGTINYIIQATCTMCSYYAFDTSTHSTIPYAYIIPA